MYHTSFILSHNTPHWVNTVTVWCHNSTVSLHCPTLSVQYIMLPSQCAICHHSITLYNKCLIAILYSPVLAKQCPIMSSQCPILTSQCPIVTSLYLSCDVSVAISVNTMPYCVITVACFELMLSYCVNTLHYYVTKTSHVITVPFLWYHSILVY